MTKAERAEKARKEARRAYHRAYWHKRTKARTKKAKLYKQRKADSKAEWQRRNPEKNVEAVQRYRDRWGRYGPSLAKEETAASAMQGNKKPLRASRRRNTGGKGKKVTPNPKTRQRETGDEGQKHAERREPSRSPRRS